MKLKPSTLALVATALLLGGIVLFIEAREANQTAITQNEATSPIYDFEETNVVGLSVETQTLTVIFERNDAGTWQLVDPEQHPAEEAAIAFLLSRLTTNGLVSTITLDAANQAEFGLDDPFATITITLADGTTHTVLLGDADFTGANVYALIDPETFPLPEDGGEVMAAVLSQDIVNGVDRPLAEWKAVVESPTESEAPEADETDETDEADETNTEATEDDESADEDADEAVDSPETDTAPPEAEAAPSEAEADTSGETAVPPASDPVPPETSPEAPDTETESPGENPSLDTETVPENTPDAESEITDTPEPQ